MSVSICIPTYGMKGEGDKFLQRNLSSIYIQSFTPDEIIISDHSSDSIIEDVVSDWSKYMNIKYFRNTYKVGSISANLNNCIKNSNCDIIDFMLQDDFYYSSNSLKHRIDNIINSKWSVTSTIHLDMKTKNYYWHLIPEYRTDIYLGYNSIGSPSLLTIYRKDAPLFDENLVMLTDCDYYKQLYDLYGKPYTSKEVTVVTCMWEGQTQNSISSEKMEKERLIVKNKYE